MGDRELRRIGSGWVVDARSASAAAQQGALLRGVVAEEGTGRLLPSATVVLAGTGIETRSGPDGTFAFPNAPLGTVSVRAQVPGYPTVVDEVTVMPGDVVFMQIFLPRTAALLDEILVTGARDALGKVGAKTAADLVAAHVPYIQGFTAAFSSQGGRAFNPAVQLRAQSSFSSDGEPMILLDGVRITGGTGRAMDVLRQIPAAQIKDIRIVRGQAAAHLYGAAAGVISIQTHSGRP